MRIRGKLIAKWGNNLAVLLSPTGWTFEKTHTYDRRISYETGGRERRKT